MTFANRSHGSRGSLLVAMKLAKHLADGFASNAAVGLLLLWLIYESSFVPIVASKARQIAPNCCKREGGVPRMDQARSTDDWHFSDDGVRFLRAGERPRMAHVKTSIRSTDAGG
jgi:hypothetical protein